MVANYIYKTNSNQTNEILLLNKLLSNKVTVSDVDLNQEMLTQMFTNKS